MIEHTLEGILLLGLLWASTMSAAAKGFELIDNGTGTARIAADGDTLYAQKADGILWCHDAAGWRRMALRKLDRCFGAIEACPGTLYTLTAQQAIWRMDGAQWTCITE